MEKSKNTPAIADAVVKRVEAMLIDGEKLLLITQPAPSRILRATLFLNLAVLVSGFIGMVFFGLLAQQMTGSPRAREANASLLPIAQLLLVFYGASGVVALYGLYWHYQSASRYIYAITRQRAIIVKPGYFSDEVKSYGRREITQLKIRPWRDGFDDLIFATQTGGKGERIDIGFLGIPEAEEVRQLMLATFEFDEHDFWKN